MTLMRLLMALARWRGGGTISYSTPSQRIRILYSSSNGSKWMSDALSLMPIRKIMLMSLRTGASLASSRMPSRSMLVSLPMLPRLASFGSDSMAWMTSMMLSSLPAYAFDSASWMALAGASWACTSLTLSRLRRSSTAVMLAGSPMAMVSTLSLTDSGSTL